jgi:hypothetical protein
MEGPEVGPAEEIHAPNEISLAQLVTFFILPSGIDLDVGSVFYWNLRQLEPAPGEDKTMKKLEQIPGKIPPGFCLRVKCNTPRDAVFKKMVHVRFERLQMSFAMLPSEKLGRLKERVADWMRTNGQGPGWTIEGGDDDPIVFEREYTAILPVQSNSVKIFLKQKELQIQSDLSWMTLSDQLVQKWGLVRGSALRIYPVDGRIQDQDNDDHSYNFEWTEGRQYWYEFIYDPLRDTEGRAKVIQLTDQYGRSDRLIVERSATTRDIAKL